MTQLQNYKLQRHKKSNKTTNELRKVYESIFNMTDLLQRNTENISDSNMNQCIENIVQFVDNNIKMNKLNEINIKFKEMEHELIESNNKDENKMKYIVNNSNEDDNKELTNNHNNIVIF